MSLYTGFAFRQPLANLAIRQFKRQGEGTSCPTSAPLIRPDAIAGNVFQFRRALTHEGRAFADRGPWDSVLSSAVRGTFM
jgi:hypothetical protein